MKCETCIHWKELNVHHRENGELVKSCDYGEHPDSCREYEEMKGMKS